MGPRCAVTRTRYDAPDLHLYPHPRSTSGDLYAALRKATRMFTSAWLKDATERVIRAFLVAFIGQLVLAAGNVFNQSTLHAAEAAGVASCLSVLLSLLGATTTNAVSPASLAPAKPNDRGAASGIVVAVVAICVAAVILGVAVNHLWLLLLLVLILLVL